MAFTEFASQVYTPSDASVTVTLNTDTSISGACRKITWTDAEGEYVTISFTEVDLSQYEEISFYIYPRAVLDYGNVFSITVDGNTYSFSREDFIPGRWNHILIDCSEMGSVTTFVITSLVENLTILFDYIGYRAVSYDCDIDVIEALKSYISLDYDVSTTLSEDIDAGDSSIYLSDSDYVTDSSVLQLDNGSGTLESVELLSRPRGTTAGDLADAITNSFTSGDTVRVLCPVRSEDYDSLEPDPLCGIVVYDMEVDRRPYEFKMKNASKIKEYLGALGICIYIDCSHKKKLLKMAREYNRKYGSNFVFILDGELVDIYLEDSIYNDGALGTNCRMAYFYKFEPQPYLYVNRGEISTITLTVDSGDPGDIE